MPWECKACNTSVDEDNVRECPQCGIKKLDWTMAADKTRTFTVATQKLRYVFGSGHSPQPAAKETPYSDEEAWENAERVVAVPKAKALLWKGNMPPSEQVLIVKPELKDEDHINITQTIEFVVGRVAQQVFDHRFHTIGWKTEGQKVTARFPFLFVFGTETLEDDLFPGITIVDITETTTDPITNKTTVGHAPQIGMKTKIGANKGDRRKRIFPVDQLEKGWVQRLECRQLVFNHDSYLILPDGLSVVALVLAHSQETKRPLLLCGHTDASGSAEYNETLAENRCLNVLHLLEGDRKAWAESAAQNYKDLRTNDKRRPDTQFLEPWLETVPRNYLSLTAWEGVFDEYEHALRAELAKVKDSPSLETLRADLAWVDPQRKVISCGEEYLKVSPKSTIPDEDLAVLDNWKGSTYTQQTNVGQMLKVKTNRRIEFLWFESDRLPWEAGEAAPTDAEARRAVYGDGGWHTWDYQSSDGPFTFDQIACPPALAIKVPPGDLVFVIDVSGSMRDPFGGGMSRMQVLKAQLEACLTALVPETRKFTMLKFGSLAGDDYFWRPDPSLPAKTLHAAKDAHREKAISWVRKLAVTVSPVNGTNTYRALEQALHVPGVEAVIFLSDGMPTAGTSVDASGAEITTTVDELEILKAVRGWRKVKKIRIDTYGFQKLPKVANKKQTSGKTIGEKLADLYKIELGKATAMTTGAHKRDVLEKLTARANATKVGGLEDWTSRKVREYLLGWFLNLLKDQNGGKFVNLTKTVSTD